MNTAALPAVADDIQPLDETVIPRRRRSSTRRRVEAHVVLAPAPLPEITPQAQAAVELDATVPPRKASVADTSLRGDLMLYGLMALLIGSAWYTAQQKWLKPNDDLNYWIGVAGGSMMLVLFAYPLRKYIGFMRALGKVKWWFWFHLTMGIAGPWLILVHSRFFHVGSLNAGVALYSMVVVVLSGVVGRFIYVRIHRGLDGERTSLKALRERAGLVESNARSRLHFAPKVEARLLAFEKRELEADRNWLTHLRQVTWLPVQQAVTYVQCVMELRAPLHKLASRYDWSAADLKRRKRRARRLVDHYLNAVVRVAQYNAFERVFAMWHMAHLPFIYLLVISAIVHVVAVHAY
ncbi:MAG: hypothetical protein U1E89_18535 [Burkholderiaceae bacterium]